VNNDDPTLLLPHSFCLLDAQWLVWPLDAGNLLTAGAYLLGFPFCSYAVWAALPHAEMPPIARWLFWLGVAFVYSCGMGHLLDWLTTHVATWGLYQLMAWQRVGTGLVSWAFVLCLFVASRDATLLVVARLVLGRMLRRQTGAG